MTVYPLKESLGHVHDLAHTGSKGTFKDGYKLVPSAAGRPDFESLMLQQGHKWTTEPHLSP